MGKLMTGHRASRISSYVSGTLLGANGEPPSATLKPGVGLQNFAFTGFSPSYLVGTEGVLVIVQPASGGVKITWPASMVFSGTSFVDESPAGVTVFDVLKYSSTQWVATMRGVPAVSVVTILMACSDEISDLEVMESAMVFRMPFELREAVVSASLTKPTLGSAFEMTFSVDGTDVISGTTPFNIPASLDGSPSPSRLTGSGILPAGSKIVVGISAVGSTSAGTGLKVYITGQARNASLLSNVPVANAPY